MIKWSRGVHFFFLHSGLIAWVCCRKLVFLQKRPHCVLWNFSWYILTVYYASVQRGIKWFVKRRFEALQYFTDLQFCVVFSRLHILMLSIIGYVQFQIWHGLKQLFCKNSQGILQTSYQPQTDLVSFTMFFFSVKTSFLFTLCNHWQFSRSKSKLCFLLNNVFPKYPFLTSRV